MQLQLEWSSKWKLRIANQMLSPPVDYEEASKDEEGGESKNWADYGNDRQAKNNC